METSDIVLLLVLLALSAVFSGSETAFVSLSPGKVKELAEKKRHGSYTLQKLKKNPHRLISTILVGNNVVNIGASALATVIFTELFGSQGVGIATGVMVFLVLVFGEVLPKSLATQYAAPIALFLAWPIYAFEKIISPVVWLLEKLTRALHKLFGAKKQQIVTEDELRAMADLGAKEGSIEKQEKEFIDNIFEFNDIAVEEIMTPRVDVDMLAAKTKIKEAMLYVEKHSHSRVPVYKGTIDNIIGILSVRDLLRALTEGKSEKRPIEAMELGNPLRVPTTKKINKLFKEFQKSRIHIAIVVDEHGGFEGIVTLEDILEEIVGEIEDEHETPERLIQRLDKHTILAKGKTAMEFIKKELKVQIDCSDHDPISWFILEALHRFPHAGEEIHVDNLVIKVEKMGKDAIEEVKITKQKPPGGDKKDEG